MNLELLDPFGRQVPDRVDATIQLPDILHYPPSHQPHLHQQYPSLTHSIATVTKKTKSSEEKHNYDDDEVDEDEEGEGDEEEEDDEIEDDDLEENSSSKVKRRSNTKQPQRQNSKNRRRTTSEKPNAGNSSINSNVETTVNIAFNHKSSVNGNDEWKAAYHVSYNRRGNYLAVGYGSGTVAIFCTLTRTLTALYYTDSNSNTIDGTTSGSSTSSTNQLFDSNTKIKSSGTTNNKGKNIKSTMAANQNSNTADCCSILSWARRSRRLLIGNYNDTRVKIFDTTHPIGAEDCASAAATIVSYGQTAVASSSSNNASVDLDDGDNDSTTGNAKELYQKASKESTAIVSTGRHAAPLASSLPNLIVPPVYSDEKRTPSPFADYDDDKKYSFVRKPLYLSAQVVRSGDGVFPSVGSRPSVKNYKMKPPEIISSTITPAKSLRYPSVSFSFEQPVVGALHIHPRYPQSGIAVLSDGSLVFFCIPFHTSGPFVQKGIDIGAGTIAANDDGSNNSSPVKIHPIHTEYHVSCASFDALGNRIYAVTKSGTVLGFDVTQFWTVVVSNYNTHHPIPTIEPTMVIPRNFGNKGGDAPSSSSLISVWHLIVSRNDKFLIVNSSDGTIRLYNTAECWNSTTAITNDIIKPTWIFQDVVTKVKFASCDLSGDGEYVVGGANGADNKYELHIWNTSTGALMDKLTGASTKLYSVAWHPTRSFLAVACSDGLVDVWGPRINWTAFAPDFQALPTNVEYIEREDEFDVDENGRHLAEGYYTTNEAPDSMKPSTTPVNVTKIERVPVFASDSEEEEEVFEFEVRVKNLFAGRVVEAKGSNKKGVVDD